MAANVAGAQLAHGRVVGVRGRAALALMAEIGGRAYTRCHWRCGIYSFGCPIWLFALRWLVFAPIFSRGRSRRLLVFANLMACVAFVLRVVTATVHTRALQHSFADCRLCAVVVFLSDVLPAAA